MIPNHAGYDYLARPLASWGYIVVSINANRGVTAAPGELTDRGLNLRRGRLVLRHLKHLVQLDTTASSPLYQKIDFSHVGLMGHSRGGEGMRAAYEQYRAPGSPWPARIGTPIGFEALFEIGPVDGQTGPRANPNRLNADGLAWTVLLPNCDGDVFNLQGVKPFDRMMLITNESPARFKATYTVWGTNHNFYNTEWQFSDSPGCLGQTRLFPRLLGSADQRAALVGKLSCVHARKRRPERRPGLQSELRSRVRAAGSGRERDARGPRIHGFAERDHHESVRRLPGCADQHLRGSRRSIRPRRGLTT